MRSFKNETDNKKELAIKKGSKLPAGAVNLRMV
jgi:hypothetical protein